MNKHKNKSAKLWLLTGLLGIVIVSASCKKAIEAKVQSFFTTENFFSTVDEANMAALGVYEIMSNVATYGWYVPMVYDYDTDIGQLQPSGITPEWRAIAHYSISPENSFLYATWSAYYTGINRANLAIERIPQMSQYATGTDAEKVKLNQYLGEAKFLRGFYYFELVRLWGDVPFKTKSSVTGDDLKLPLTDRYIIYEQIVKDMQEAAVLLPTATPVDERVNKWAAKAMLARVALFAGGYSLRADKTMQRPDNYRDFYVLAKQQIDDIMANNPYQLNSSYAQVFKDQCQHKLDPGENIFTVSFYNPTGTGSANNTSAGTFNAPQTALGAYGSTLYRTFALPNFYNTFDSADWRRDFAIARYQVNAAGARVYYTNSTANSSWAPGKWSREYQTNTLNEKSNTNIDYTVLRYADLLLMRAEVENELNGGPNQLAYDAINQVRNRAYGLNTTGNRIVLTVTTAGSGYTAAPVITISGGGGFDAAATVSVTSGRLNVITMQNRGYGYTSAPTVTLTGAGTGGVITATLVPRPTAAQVALPQGLNQQAFLDSVKSERAKELCYEGMRRADLIRWNALAGKIADTRAALTAIRSNYLYIATDNFKANQHELYPFPLNETDVNKNITRQNPGY